VRRLPSNGVATRASPAECILKLKLCGPSVVDIGQWREGTVFALNVEHFSEFHEVRREYFPSEPPASTMVEVSRLVNERMLIEFNAIAALP